MQTKQNFCGARNPRQALILHVDDDLNDMELFHAAVRKSGAALTLKTMPTTAQAMHYLEHVLRDGSTAEHPAPAVILLDLHLSCETGLDLLLWLNARPGLRQIPVVVLSGSESHVDIHRAYAAGAVSYFVKPLGLRPLIDLVSEIYHRWCQPGPEAGSVVRRASLWSQTSPEKPAPTPPRPRYDPTRGSAAVYK